MSELIIKETRRDHARWRLLTTVSAMALVTSACVNAEADEADRPTVWIEVGSQFENISRSQDTFTAPFLLGPQPLEPFPFLPRPVSSPGTLVDKGIPSPFEPVSPFAAQTPPSKSFGGEAKIIFEPHDSDWVFSASMRYGRANGRKEVIKGIPVTPYLPNNKYAFGSLLKFSDATARYNESHAILDFQAGKDVGLGFLGRHASSILTAGVRFAQFTSKSVVGVNADTSQQIYEHRPYASKYGYSIRFHTYAFNAHSERSFHGIGPSLSWTGSAPVIGNADTAEFTFDWGINGAILFGRQKARTSHSTNGYDRYLYRSGMTKFHTQYKNATSTDRTHSIVSPNLGGFAGFSLKFPNAKVSLGYRADFFFGAMDAGIDTRHSEDVSFHGPFAKISIGLGG